jgi:tetratricopeptide (TPR) repeat protein
MLVFRDRELLRREPLQPSDGAMMLSARREGSRLSFGAGGGSARFTEIEFPDPFPLPAEPDATFGILWKRGLQLSQLIARRQSSSTEASRLRPIVKGDARFLDGEYSSAAQSYREASSLEAQVKEALCYSEMADEADTESQAQHFLDRYRTICHGVFQRSRIMMTQEEQRWHSLAGIHLVRIYARERDWVSLGRIRNELSQPAQLMQLLPVQYRNAVFNDLAATGARSRLLFDDEAGRDLDNAFDLLEALGDDPARLRQLHWRRADRHRVDGEREEAIQIVKGLIEQGSLDPQQNMNMEEQRSLVKERIALVADLAWMLRLEGKRDQAIEAIESWLERNEEYQPLLVERARIYVADALAEDSGSDAAKESFESARKDLQTFFEIELERLTHAEFATACLLNGIVIRGLGGDEERVKQAFLRGARRNWKANPRFDPDEISKASSVEMVYEDFALQCEGLVNCWAGVELTEQETEDLLESLVVMSGLGNAAAAKAVLKSFPPDLMQRVASNYARGRHGKMAAERMLLRHYSLAEHHQRGVQLVMFDGVMQSALKGDEPVSEELKDEAFVQVFELVSAFIEGKIDINEIGLILDLWRTKQDPEAWTQLREKLNPDLRSAMSLIFGRMCSRAGKTVLAREYLTYVTQHGKEESPIVQDAEKQLDALDISG